MPRIVRTRKMPGNGTSGAFVRSSISTNATSSTIAPPSSRNVVDEPQPDVVGVDQRVDQQRQAGGHRDRARDVEVARAVVAALGQQARGHQRRGDADRHVDEQHPLPARPLGEHAAEQHAGGAAGAGHRAPDAQRLVALRALLEDLGDQRQGGGRQQRGAEALDGTRGDQPDVVLGEPACKRGAREQDQAGDEHAPAAEQVGHAPAEQQEPAEGERVGVDDPRQVVLGEVQRSADRGQRDVRRSMRRGRPRIARPRGVRAPTSAARG